MGTEIVKLSTQRQNDDNFLTKIYRDRATGQIFGAKYIPELLILYEQFWGVFGDDWMPDPTDNYPEWTDWVLSTINDTSLLYVILDQGKVIGSVWADSWEVKHKGPFSCKMGIFVARGTSPDITQRAARYFLKVLFEYGVYVVRVEIDAQNRASRIGAIRAGFRNPEPRRAYRIKGGNVSDGIIYSITQPEFEELSLDQ